MSIGSSAAEVSESIRDYVASDDYIMYGNTYLPDSYFMDFELDSEDDYYGAENNVFWHMGEMLQLFTTSPDVYGYRVYMERTSMRNISSSSIASRWICGTPTDLMNGNNVGNFDGVDAQYVAFWIPSNYAHVQIRLAPLFCFVTDETQRSLGSYSIDATYRFVITPYESKKEYESAFNSIQSELETQTGEMKEQTGELKEQTEQSKQQTETQKGMLAKMTDFFGNFFENLKNSVIGLFVPSKEEMGDILQRFNTFFEETFGVLFYPFTVLGRCINYLLTSEGHTSAMLPGFSIMGFTVWNDLYFDLTSIPIVNDVFNYVRMGMGVVITFAFINYMRNFFDRRFGGGGG